MNSSLMVENCCSHYKTTKTGMLFTCLQSHRTPSTHRMINYLTTATLKPSEKFPLYSKTADFVSKTSTELLNTDSERQKKETGNECTQHKHNG